MSRPAAWLAVVVAAVALPAAAADVRGRIVAVHDNDIYFWVDSSQPLPAASPVTVRFTTPDGDVVTVGTWQVREGPPTRTIARRIESHAPAQPGFEVVVAVPEATNRVSQDRQPGRSQPGVPLKVLQDLLNQWGYDAGPPDGRMGPRTRAAIRAFQRDAGLTDSSTTSDEFLAAVASRQAGGMSERIRPKSDVPTPAGEADLEAGLDFRDGRNGKPRDDGRAFAHLQRAAAAGNPRAMMLVGEMYRDGRGTADDDGAAFAWFKKAADAGHRDAFFSVGYAYFVGRGVAQAREAACDWFGRSADAGSGQGANALGYCYMQGIGVAIDYAEAQRWFRKAADQNIARALFNLGQLYDHGYGVRRDAAEAERYYRRFKAMLGGDRFHEIAQNYEEGIRGLPQDRDRAIHWYKVGAADGEPAAQARLKELGIAFEPSPRRR